MHKNSWDVLIARLVPHPGCGIELPDAFCTKRAILSKVPDLRSVVILERHRENREQQGKVGHSRTRAVVLNRFYISYPFCQTKLPDLPPIHSMVVNLLIY